MEEQKEMEEQKITIRSLVPELCEDWLQYFDKIAFQDHEDWAFCYCLEGHLDRKTQEEWTHPGERRTKAIELIHAGEMQGYLAYLGEKVIGWCNVNDRENYQYLTAMFREIGYCPEDIPGTRVKAIFCFLIAPEYRGRGVAQSLLNRICRDAERDGYDYIEVYPFSDEKFEFPYHGTRKMYERNGFTETADLKWVKIMQKRLKKKGEQNMSNTVLETMKQRSSARAYSAEKLTEKELNCILEAGLQAPTATNRQEIHFSVTERDNPILSELDEEKSRLRGQEKQPHNFYYEAPTVIFLSAEDGFRWSGVDAGIAVQNMALAAESIGLGSLIIGCVYDALHGEKKEYFSQALQIPEGYSFQIALAAGHKTDNKIPHTYDFERQVTVL